MKKSRFIKEYGIPETLIDRMLHSEYVNQFAQKLNPDKTNSPWLINASKAIEMLEEGYWRKV